MTTCSLQSPPHVGRRHVWRPWAVPSHVRPPCPISLCPYSQYPGLLSGKLCPTRLAQWGAYPWMNPWLTAEPGTHCLSADTTRSWLHPEAAMTYSPAVHAGWPDLGARVCLFYLLPFHNRCDSKNVYQLLAQWLTSTQRRKSLLLSVFNSKHFAMFASSLSICWLLSTWSFLLRESLSLLWSPAIKGFLRMGNASCLLAAYLIDTATTSPVPSLLIEGDAPSTMKLQLWNSGRR